MSVGREKKLQYQLEVKGTEDILTFCKSFTCNTYQMKGFKGKKIVVADWYDHISIWDCSEGCEINNTLVQPKYSKIFPLPNGFILYGEQYIKERVVYLNDPKNKINTIVDPAITIHPDLTAIIDEDTFACINYQNGNQINIYKLNNFNKPIHRIILPKSNRNICSLASLGQDKLIICYYRGHFDIYQKQNKNYKKLSFSDSNYFQSYIHSYDNNNFILLDADRDAQRISLWNLQETGVAVKIKEEIPANSIYHSQLMAFPNNAKTFLTCENFTNNIHSKEIFIWDAENLKSYSYRFDDDIRLITPISPSQVAIVFLGSQDIVIYQSQLLMKNYIRKIKSHAYKEILSAVECIDPDSTGIVVDYYADDNVALPLANNPVSFFKQPVSNLKSNTLLENPIKLSHICYN